MKNNLENKAYSLYLTTNGNMTLIAKASKSLNLDINTFLNLVTYYINNNKSKSDYALLFNKLEQCNTYQEIIDTIQKTNLSLDYLKLNFANYINLYRPNMLVLIEQYNHLYNALKVYENYLSKKNKSFSKINDEYYKQALQAFIKSNYTLEKFLFMYRSRKTEFNTYIDRVKTIDPALYLEFMETNKYRENVKNFFIQKDIFKLLNKIKELGNDFNSIDYFTLTNFGIDEVIQVADKILIQVEDLKLFRKAISKFKRIKVYNETGIKQLYKQRFIYFINNNSIEASIEDKETVISYLNDYGIPISNITFDDAMHGYFKGLLPTKKKI